MTTHRNTEENNRKRKERYWLSVMDRSNKSGNRKRPMEETCEWSDSPKGETEISQVRKCGRSKQPGGYR